MEILKIGKTPARRTGVVIFSTLLIFGLLAGCRKPSQGYILENINAGRMTPSNQTAPGDADPLASLVILMAYKPDSTRYIVNWENFYPPNTIHSNRMEFDADEGMLWVRVDGKSRTYSRVTREALKSVRAANESTDTLPKYGARQDE